MIDSRETLGWIEENGINPKMALDLMKGDIKIILIGNYDDDAGALQVDAEIGFDRTPKDKKRFVIETLKTMLQAVENDQMIDVPSASDVIGEGNETEYDN